MITYDAAVYVVNPDSRFYNNRRYFNSLKRFISSINIPHALKELTVERLNTITIKDLKPLDRTFNIVILPTRAYYFDIQVHSGKIMLLISHHPGNGSVSWGFYYPAFTLIKKFLFELKPLDLDSNPYRKLKPEGKALILAVTRILADGFTWTDALNRARKLKLKSKLKMAVINSIILKSRDTKLYGDQHVR